MIRHLQFALAFIFALFAGGIAHAQSGPFTGLEGQWSGNGNITLDDGSNERIRCRATYAVNAPGTGMNLNLVCASASYKFDLRADVAARGNSLSGRWSETSRGITGDLEGRAASGRFNVLVSAPIFNANLSLTTTGNKQSISISSQSQFRNVAIALSRA